jgi:hypothetical protein
MTQTAILVRVSTCSSPSDHAFVMRENHDHEGGLEDCQSTGDLTNLFTRTETCESTMSSPQPTGVAPRYSYFSDFNTALANCADGQVTGFTVCVRCPIGAVFEPRSNRCVTCNGEDVVYGRGNTTGLVGSLRVAGVVGDEYVRCAGCLAPECATSPGDAERGIAPWTLTANAKFCTRCEAGSRQYQCTKDDECLLFGRDMRCAGAGWNGRRNAPSGGVCVPRCKSDSDCAGGICDLSDPRNPGTCLNAAPNPNLIVAPVETPSGARLLCRPIGCDECWNNSFCGVGAVGGCPEHHVCFENDDPDQAISSPVCVLRPVLSLEAKPLFDPDTSHPENREAHDKVRLAILERLRQFHLPRYLGTPFFLGTPDPSPMAITRLFVQIEDIHIFFTGGKLVVRLDMSTALINGAVHLKRPGPGESYIDETFFVYTRPFPIFLTYGLFVGPSGGAVPPAMNMSQAYSGLGFTLVDISIDPEFVLPVPLPTIDLSTIEGYLDSTLGSQLRDALGTKSDIIMDTLLVALGGLQGGDPKGRAMQISRCIVGRPGNEPPKRCWNGQLPPIYSALIGTGQVDAHLPSCPPQPPQPEVK